VSRETRDLLIQSLHYNQGVQVDQLAQWFRRSRQVVKRAIRSLSTDPREDAESRQLAVKSRGTKRQVLQIIRGVIESKTDLVTIRLLRRRIKEGMDLDISAQKLRTLLTADLALTWKKDEQPEPVYQQAAQYSIVASIFAAADLPPPAGQGDPELRRELLLRVLLPVPQLAAKKLPDGSAV
jgi:transposase